MAGNLISFLVLLAVVALFIWLMTRAWRARRWFIKWPALVLSGLLTLIFAFVTFLAGKGLAFMYIPPAPAPDLTIEGTQQQIARGQYLASIACVGCHSASRDREFPLSGGRDFARETGLPIGAIVAANLTPGGVLAERTDGELFRTIRYGYAKNQRAANMSFLAFRQLSDEDIIAIIAFLRSQEPVTTLAQGGDELNILGVILMGGISLTPLEKHTEEAISAPSRDAPTEYGKYVATYGDCQGCHGADMTGGEATAFGPAAPDPRRLVATLTLEQFIAMMRTGKRPDGSELNMPWQTAAKMSDDDLAAIYAYLSAPVK